MPTPKEGYWLDGEKIPSVTTICGRFKDSGGLLWWAWTEGKAGRDFRETRDKAADAGTCCHEMVECSIRGLHFDESRYSEEVRRAATPAFEAYLAWKGQTNLTSYKTEQAMISKAHRFGGTMDVVFVHGKLALGDWKTSNRLYVDHLIQLAAYGILWQECYPEEPIEGGFHLLRFSKQQKPDDPVQFTHTYYSQLDLAAHQFLLLREAYEIDKRLKTLI